MNVRGVEWADYGAPYDSDKGRASLDALKTAIPSCNWVGLNMNVMTSGSTPSVSDSEKNNIEYAIMRARMKGYKIAVRLMCFNRENANPQTWLSNFKDLCRELGTWLQDRKVELFTCGGEMLDLEKPEYFDLWTQLIDGVRGVYSGKITYNTNWAHNQTTLDIKLNNAWFPKLDVQAVSAYPNLYPYQNMAYKTPTLAEVYDRFEHWCCGGSGFQGQNIAEKIKLIASHFNKPLIIYCGCSSYKGVMANPAKPYTKIGSPVASIEEQDLYIKGLFHYFSDIEGMIYDAGCFTGDTNPCDFSLKPPAQDTIEMWFNQLKPEPLPEEDKDLLLLLLLLLLLFMF